MAAVSSSAEQVSVSIFGQAEKQSRTFEKPITYRAVLDCIKEDTGKLDDKWRVNEPRFGTIQHAMLDGQVGFGFALANRGRDLTGLGMQVRGDRLEISRTDAASAGPGPAKIIHVIPKPASARQDVGLLTHAATSDPTPCHSMYYRPVPVDGYGPTARLANCQT